MPVGGRWAVARATSYSTCIAAAVRGEPQRGVIHSAFSAAANIAFPGGFLLSLNAATSPRMPNGLQLSARVGTFPFLALRPGMPVLLGAQRLLIEAIDCSLDLSTCTQWNPHIERPASLDMDVVSENMEWLEEYVAEWKQERAQDHRRAVARRIFLNGIGPCGCPGRVPAGKEIAQSLCGRGPGLTPTGDDILAGWMAINWLIQGSTPHLIEACQQIMLVAREQTHLLSQCWLSYAAEGNVALPIRTLLYALTQDNNQELAHATQGVLSIGATSGYDVIQGILLVQYPDADC